MNILYFMNIQVVLIQLPGAGTILEDEQNSGLYDLSEEKIYPVIESHFSDIPFFNYSSMDNEWTTNDFSDRGHLNYLGARKLGEFLENDLKNILIK